MNMNETFLGSKDDETNVAYTVCTMRIYEFIEFNRFFTVKHAMGVIPSAHTYLGKIAVEHSGSHLSWHTLLLGLYRCCVSSSKKEGEKTVLLCCQALHTHNTYSCGRV